MGKYDEMEINLDYLRNLNVVSQQINPVDRLKAIGYWARQSQECKRLAYTLGTSFSTISGMVATLSPGISLELSREYAENIFRELNSGIKPESLTLYGAYGWDNIRKAANIYFNGDKIVSGQKVLSVHNLLLTPDSKDWIALGEYEVRALSLDYESPREAFRLNKYQYPYIARHFNILAERFDLLPCAMQQIVHRVVKQEMSNQGKVNNLAV